MRWLGGPIVLGVVLCALASPAHAIKPKYIDQDAGVGAGSGSAPVYIDPADLMAAPELSAAASPGEVQLGGRFVLIVTAIYDDGVTVILPASLDLGDSFEERRRTTTDKTRSDGKKIREWQVELLAWDLGEMMLPPVQISVIRGGSPEIMLTNAVPIKIVGTLGDMVDTAEPRGYAPPMPLWRRTWMWLLIAAGAVLVLAIVGFLLLRRRRRPITVFVPTITARISGAFRRPRYGAAAEEALARLEAIDTSGMLARDRKVAYTEMIDVIQSFLGRQLGGTTDDLTTGELRAWLGKSSIATATRLELSRWLDECDLVKFGGLHATVEDGKGHLAGARELVISIAMPTTAAAAEALEGANPGA